MKRVTQLKLFVALLSFCFIACQDSSTTATSGNEAKPAFDLASAKAAIEKVNAEFGALAAKNDTAGIAALYTTDGKLMASNMPSATGQKNIQSAFAGMFAALGQISAKLTAVDFWGNESAVTEEGVYSLTDKDGKEIDKGKYLVVWKMEDGKWKLHRDCFNSDLPVPVPAK
jgi:uncharacterized protein (TIGR02246 family)